MANKKKNDNPYGAAPIGNFGGGGGGNNNNNNNNKNNNNNNNNNKNVNKGYTPEYGYVKPPPGFISSGNKPPYNPGNDRTLLASGGGGRRNEGGSSTGGGLLDNPNEGGGSTANTDPKQTIRLMLMKSGLVDSSDPDYLDWATQKLLDEYSVAQLADRSLNPLTWMQTAYGAGFGSPAIDPIRGDRRKHGGRRPDTPGVPESPFSSGTIGASITGESYEDYKSENDPRGYLASTGAGGGLYGGGGGGAEFQNFFQNEFADSVLAGWQAEKLKTPGLSLHDYIKDRDLTAEARAQFTDFQSNKDPIGYLMGQGMAGGMSGDAEFQDFFRNSYAPMIVGAFNAARANNPNLSMAQFMAGEGAGLLAQAQAAFGHFKANTDPVGYLMGQGANRGIIMPQGGNADYMNFYRQDAIPRVQSQWQGKRSGNPDFNLDDFVAGRDLAGNTQMNYLFRPMAQRAPGPVNLAGRYSWWS